ncbi:exonuclease [Lophiostoma macrostomum CBS 122681]|uniref:Exonuclease n=1 Tax=Lophiostoma macrostomum CBS 122681 TaxID=1314788 RepID=A0A6A6TBL2_9PLEO|nr:exonuclease [Lophiostoma macrostomum CBS 122681]
MESINMPTAVINTVENVATLVDLIWQLPTDFPSLFVDLEGINLSRYGSISILTLLIQKDETLKHTYLFDIHTLGAHAFNTAGRHKKTLKDILESPIIRKVFFDVRNDSDALFSLFNVALQGIEDVQLMENASLLRGATPRAYLTGLASCIKFDAGLSWEERATWEAVKDEGKRLFAPERGGNYEVFNTRPMLDAIKEYCVGDVQYLPRLRLLYCANLSAEWQVRIAEATRDRLTESWSANYQPQGRDKTQGPWIDSRQAAGRG